MTVSGNHVRAMLPNEINPRCSSLPVAAYTAGVGFISQTKPVEGNSPIAHVSLESVLSHHGIICSKACTNFVCDTGVQSICSF